MKRKLIISLMVALVMVLVPSSVAFAGEYFDIEDPCVADNDDFIDGVGWDGGSSEQHFGGQSWEWEQPPADDYNLYQDDVSDTGNLDEIRSLIVRNPDALELLGFTVANAYPENEPPFYYMNSEVSPDTWYWALEPRGYNLPAPQEGYDRYKGLSGVFWVEVLNFSGFDTFKWDDWSSVDRVLRDPVVASNKVNGLICTLYIPEGTHLSYPDRPYTLVTNLFVEKDDLGEIYFEPGNMDFSQPCVLALTHQDWAEQITFTQIRDGLPVE